MRLRACLERHDPNLIHHVDTDRKNKDITDLHEVIGGPHSPIAFLEEYFHTLFLYQMIDCVWRERTPPLPYSLCVLSSDAYDNVRSPF